MSIQQTTRPETTSDELRRAVDERAVLERNKDVARQVIDRIFVHQEDRAIDDLVARDFVPHTFGPMAPGREGLREGMRRASAGVSDARFEIHDMVAEGDRVAVRLTSTARHTGTFMGMPPTGNSYSIDELHLFRIRDGQLIEHWHAFDTMDLVRQLRGPGGETAAAPGERETDRDADHEVELGYSPDRPSPEDPPRA